VCYLDSVFRGAVLPFGRIFLSAWWWVHGALPESSECFLWVTTQQGPQNDPTKDIDQLILDLVS
jgi:hypothetical protein